MGYIQITGSAYINPRHIVSIDLDIQCEKWTSGEYTKNVKSYSENVYILTIKMSNGDSYKERYKSKIQMEERRESLYIHW